MHLFSMLLNAWNFLLLKFLTTDLVQQLCHFGSLENFLCGQWLYNFHGGNLEGDVWLVGQIWSGTSLV
jgi:hypothetical protein